jgi:hypothetical protein
MIMALFFLAPVSPKKMKNIVGNSVIAVRTSPTYVLSTLSQTTATRPQARPSQDQRKLQG